MNKNYNYFYNEQGDYTVVFKVDTDEETYIAICQDAEKADLICKALNYHSEHPEILNP